MVVLQIIRFGHQRAWIWPQLFDWILLLLSRSKNCKESFCCRIPDRELLAQYRLLNISLSRLQPLCYSILSFQSINNLIYIQGLVQIINHLKLAIGSSLHTCYLIRCQTRWHDVVHGFDQSIDPKQELILFSAR